MSASEPAPLDLTRRRPSVEPAPAAVAASVPQRRVLSAKVWRPALPEEPPAGVATPTPPKSDVKARPTPLKQVPRPFLFCLD